LVSLSGSDAHSTYLSCRVTRLGEFSPIG
jgi:hypothetical protein